MNLQFNTIWFRSINKPSMILNLLNHNLIKRSTSKITNPVTKTSKKLLKPPNKTFCTAHSIMNILQFNGNWICKWAKRHKRTPNVKNRNFQNNFYSNLKLHLQKKLIFYDLFGNQHVIYSLSIQPSHPLLKVNIAHAKQGM